MNHFFLLLRLRWLWLLKVSVFCAFCGFLLGYLLFKHEAAIAFDHVALAEKVSAVSASNDQQQPALREELIVLFRSAAARPSLGQVAESRNGLTIAVRRPDLPALATAVRSAEDDLTSAIRQTLNQRSAQIALQSSAASVAIEKQLLEATTELVALQQTSGITDETLSSAAFLRQIAEVDEKTTACRAQLAATQLQIDLLLKALSKFSPALIAAREALAQALVHYTDESAKVKELKGPVATLEKQAASMTGSESEGAVWTNPLATALLTKITELKTDRLAALNRLNNLDLQREEIQKQLQGFPANHGRYAALKSRSDSLLAQQSRVARNRTELLELELGLGRFVQTSRPLNPSSAWEAMALAGLRSGVWAGLGGFLLASLALTRRPLRVGSIRELARLSGLPVLASIPDLSRLPPSAREQWAFDTFTLLRGRLRSAPNQGLVCGFTSSHPGEGRSTCIGLLKAAAERQGFRVMTVDASSPAEPMQVVTVDPALSLPEPPVDDSATPSEKALSPRTSHQESAPLALAIWNYEHRNAWREVSQQWLTHRNLVVFIDLPPASAPESLLLAEQLPNVIWICGDDRADAPEITSRLTQLRDVHTNLSGCIFNSGVKNRPRSLLSRLSVLVPVLAAICIPDADAQQPSTLNSQLSTINHQLTTNNQPSTINYQPTANPQPSANSQLPTPNSQLRTPNSQLSTPNSQPSSPVYYLRPPNPQLSTLNSQLAKSQLSAPADTLAPWQTRLTLGPGDVLEISLHDQPETTRPGLIVGPDGRINYLEARDFMVTGLTVDELRTSLETVLAKFHRAPRAIVNPMAYNSKKYFILGNVNQKGVFPLDRPTSIIEAIAKAKGFVSQVQNRNTLVEADLGRSFLVRRAIDGALTYIGIDFEGLFQRGELAQNIPLQPDDYLFFPPLGLQELYVLGEVHTPGIVPYTQTMTALGAITARGGFTDRAWKTRVLVVRGSLSRPSTFVVNIADVLTAKGPDFPLSNRDIVFVHGKPWAKAEELLESAAIAFAQAFVIGIAGQNIPAIIKEPWIK